MFAGLRPPGSVARPFTFTSSRWRRPQHILPATSLYRWPRDRSFPSQRRCHTTEAGEEDSGHIRTGQNEGIFFFDNVFPLKISWLGRIPFLNPEQVYSQMLRKVHKPNIAMSDASGIIERAIPEHLPLKVSQVIPRLGDGGAFVKFTHDGSISPEDLEGTLKEYLEQNPIRPWFNPFRRVRAFLVLGKPWLEDLSRFPTSTIKVEFLPTSPESAAAEIPQEQLFSVFRRFGRLVDITPQPSDSKVSPRYAYIDFTRTRFATMAKNTMHGFILIEGEGGGKSGTILKLSYDRKAKSHWIRDWITNHPRIVIPIVVALLTAGSVAVFDPIRTMFIKYHITHGLHISDNKYYKWVMSWLNRSYDLITFRKNRPTDEGLKAVWADRKTAIDQLRSWMIETADTFIVVQGPRGAGKKELVMDQALKDMPNKLVIDCKKIQEARGDSKTIAVTAAEVGYRPVFSWMNSISSMLDLAATATIGTKTGFSETLDGQLSKIMSNTTTALRQVALGNRRKDDRDAHLADDDWLEAHPEFRPVVVIDNFLHKTNEGASDLVYDKMADWGAQLTTQNAAHVIFLTTDVSFSKSLGKALPDRVFRQVTLGDCSPEVAKQLVIRHLDADADIPAPGEKKLTPSQMRTDLDELDGVIQVLGGRLTDLEFLARRIKAGESPGKAVTAIINQSASEILKMYIFDTDRKWSPQQSWYLIKQLANNETLKYNEVLLSDMFSGNGEAALQALEQAELISVQSAHGRPTSIKAGKPVYQAAFERVIEDEVLRCKMDLSIISQLLKGANGDMDKYETELRTLAELPGMAAQLRPRVQWLLAKAQATQVNIEKLEAQSGKLKKVLGEKY